MQFTGKTVEEATELGLKEMGLDLEKAEITVVEQPTKGLFGILKGKAVVEIVAKPENEKVEVKEEKALKANKASKEHVDLSNVDASSTVEFVQKILDLMDINAKAKQTESVDNAIVIDVIAEKGAKVIGFRGEVIDAIQTLAGAERNIGKKDYEKVVVDCENYREKRKETLINLAHKLEAKATDMRRSVILEPMSPFERRIIHTALMESTTVKTESEGSEPNRYVVIIPNEKDEFAKPYNAGRNNDRNHKGGKNFKGKGGRDHRNGGGKKFNHNSDEKKKPSSMFGTYLGNSLK